MSAVTTRDRILDALEQLLIANGPSAVTLEAVAAAASVSKGGLLYHFGSKEALLLGLVQRLVDRADTELTRAAEDGASVARSYLATSIPGGTRHLPLYRSLLAALRSADNSYPDIDRALRSVFTKWAELLRAELGDPVLAEIVRLVGDGVFLAGLVGLPQPAPALLDAITERLLPGDPQATA